MKTNSDEAIGLINLLTQPPSGFPSTVVNALRDLATIVKVMDEENFKLRQEVQMLRAVLEQDREKIC
jgi:hypothetical protein